MKGNDRKVKFWSVRARAARYGQKDRQNIVFLVNDLDDVVGF